MIQCLRAICHLNRLNYPRFAIQRRLPAIPVNFGPIRDMQGVRYAAYPSGDDHVAKALFWFGGFDPWVVRTMKMLSQPGDTVVDVGANLGDTALPLAQRVGPEGRVFCFEPLPENIRRLETNVAANRFGNVQVCPFALTRTPATLEIEIIEGQPGMSQVADKTPKGTTCSVEGRRFDDWARDSGLCSVAVCKIDVQGHELDVLEGMGDFITGGKIAAIVFEHEGVADPAEPLLSFFLRNGYRIWRIENRLFSNVYTPLEAPHRARRTRDFVAAVPGSRSAEILANIP